MQDLKTENKKTMYCLQCGKGKVVFLSDVKLGRGKYCSKVCEGLFRRNKPLSLEHKKNIGKAIKGRVSPTKGMLRPNHSARMSLASNPNWRGGKSFEPYAIGWTKTFKEQIRYRDGYKCQVCGKPETENLRKLDVHHKDYDKQNIKEENLISLCQSCHMRTNFNREYWKEVFSERS